MWFSKGNIRVYVDDEPSGKLNDRTLALIKRTQIYTILWLFIILLLMYSPYYYHCFYERIFSFVFLHFFFVCSASVLQFLFTLLVGAPLLYICIYQRLYIHIIIILWYYSLPVLFGFRALIQLDVLNYII